MPQPGPSFYEAARAILAALGAPETPENVNILVAWSWCEKPHPDGAWQWNNPLNTTWRMPGSRSVNAQGVQEYPDRETGIQATVNTLLNAGGGQYYPNLVAALRASDPAHFLNAVDEIRRWGTNPDCIRSVYAALPPPPPLQPIPQTPPPAIPSVPPPALPQPALSPWVVALAAGLIGAGLAALGYLIFAPRPRLAKYAPGRPRRETVGRFAVARWQPPSAELVEHATEPMTVGDLARNLKRRLEERGVRIIVRDIPAPETGGGVILAHYHRTPTGQDVITLSSAVANTLDTPFGFSVLAHEAAHALLHNPECWPKVTRSHEREEQDAELVTIAALAELELPIETYEGVVYPPGSIQVSWEEVKAYDPTAYRNVRWAAEWIVRAARGEDSALAREPCPALRELMRL